MGGGIAPAVCSCCTKRDELEYQDLPPGGGRPIDRRQFGERSWNGSMQNGNMQGHSASSSGQLAGQQPLGTGPCILCREAPANMVCLPCGHLLVCFRCSLRYVMSDGSSLHPDICCPSCKQHVHNFQRVYLQSPASMQARHEAFRSESFSNSGSRSQLAPRSYSHHLGNAGRNPSFVAR
mmetsp:Transcript_8897/g.19567  ORF Transcript_8897/g.19567 Transcript_8897/m.19567 type:complete len:179 (+) Transcript_8897:117-653(+)